MDPALQTLAECFAHTLSPSLEAIKQAEAHLKALSNQPGYGTAVLKLIAEPSIPTEIRQAAAVNFKNYVKYRWDLSDADNLGLAAAPVPDEEKAQIKAHLVDLMLSAPHLVRAQLSEALSIISTHDFPAKWQTLLPMLIERLQTNDVATMNGVLQTANSIFKRYRGQFMTDALSKELEYSQMVVQPLLAVFQKLSAQMKASSNTEELKGLLSNVRFVCTTFYSLNSPGLTEPFENTLDAWMAEFHFYLAYDNPGLAEHDPERESVVDAVKAAVCENINLFMEMNEEEFAKFLQTFAQDVWSLLMSVGPNPGQDYLAMSAIRFLTTVSRSVHHGLFKDPVALQQICENIIVPNIKIRDDVEEMFDMNFVEYIRRDTEGSDTDTRRRAASDLVKSLTDKFPQEVTALFSGYVASMLAEYARDPMSNWKAKDCAVYLVIALTVKGKTAAAGATTTNQLVNILDFLGTQILPEIQAADVNSLPFLKADALKFITTFRMHIPKEVLLSFFPNLIRLLQAESNVVHSYAAICIERLLAMKDGTRSKFTPDELSAQLQPLLENLFAAFRLPESSENEWVMKCVMRVISFVGNKITPVATVCIQQLAHILLSVCKNPTQPGFNHYLFESIAAIIRHSCAANPNMVGSCEEMLFPAFQIVLQEDVQEFHPYVFQIFAQLIEARKPPLPAIYGQLFPPLLSPTFWERSGNVPALVRLLQAYITHAPELVVQGHLQAVLGVFQKLLASKAHDHEGFNILNCMLLNVDYAALAPFMPQVWTLLFNRLQTARTTKYTRGFLGFVTRFACKHGVQLLSESIDRIQPGLLMMILQNVLLPNISSVSGEHEEKLLGVGVTKLLVEVPQLQAPEQAELWGKLLAATLQHIGGSTATSAGVEDEDGDVEYTGYSAAYAKLHNADRPDTDPLPSVKDVWLFVVSTLSDFSTTHPGKASTCISSCVEEPVRQQLQLYCQQTGRTIQ